MSQLNHLKNHTKKAFSVASRSLGIGLVGYGVLMSQDAEAQQAEEYANVGQKQGRLSAMFNNSEITTTGWGIPLEKFDADGNTTLRIELGYADFTPGFYIHQKLAPGQGQVDVGYMNFSQNIFPLGDTLSFNGSGKLYSNGEQSGDQLGIRYNNSLTINNSSYLEYSAFAGAAVVESGFSTGVNANYHKDLGSWHLLAGAGVSWMGERDVVTFNAIGAVQRSFRFEHLPDGKLTAGVLLKNEFGKGGVSRLTAFSEYQTHLVQNDGPRCLQNLSLLFGTYASTDSYGGKVGALYTPGRISKRDFGVSFGPSVGWDSKEKGPLIGFELRGGF